MTKHEFSGRCPANLGGKKNLYLREKMETKKGVKPKITKEEIETIEDFLRRFYGFNREFDFYIEYWERYKDRNQSTDDELALTKLLVMNGIIRFHILVGHKEYYIFTEKAIEIYDHNGYENWEKFNEDRIKFTRESPDIARQSFKNTKIISRVTLFVAICGLIISILNYIDSRNRLKQEGLQYPKTIQLD